MLALHVQLLKESLAKNQNDESVDECLDILSTEVQRINQVLENFRDFASLRELVTNNSDIQLLLEGVIRLTKIEADKRGIKLQLNCETNSKLFAWVDSTRVEQVILNLIVNAYDAMPNGGQLTITLQKSGEMAEILVSDTGCGIPVDMQDKVFDPYFTTKAKGTGLGLAISDKIIRQHNGTIDFVTGSQGTTFRLSLPKSKSNTAIITSHA
ncbi:MAG: ATP-binding protein [Pirellulaceae bacterium]